MKKAAPGPTVPATMGPEKAPDVESYLAACPEPHRTTLEKLRATIRSVVPKETTEEISYGVPTFQYKGGLVAYAAFKQHCSFFLMSGMAGGGLRRGAQGVQDIERHHPVSGGQACAGGVGEEAGEGEVGAERVEGETIGLE